MLDGRILDALARLEADDAAESSVTVPLDRGLELSVVIAPQE